MLFYVIYDGGTEAQYAVISAETQNEAEEWASLEAEEAYYLDNMQDEDYESEEWENIVDDSMAMSTYYHIEEFDEENPDHMECLELQSGEPIEI